MDIYGDIEGNNEIISRIIKNFNKHRISIFLGDILANYDNEELFNNSLKFLEWLLMKFTKIEHKDLSNNKYLNIWNKRGIQLKHVNSDIINEISKIILKLNDNIYSCSFQLD